MRQPAKWILISIYLEIVRTECLTFDNEWSTADDDVDGVSCTWPKCTRQPFDIFSITHLRRQSEEELFASSFPDVSADFDRSHACYCRVQCQSTKSRPNRPKNVIRQIIVIARHQTNNEEQTITPPIEQVDFGEPTTIDKVAPLGEWGNQWEV